MLIAPSPLVDDMRGTVVNTTFQQSLAGLQARWRGQAVKPKSLLQFITMASLSSLGAIWKSPAMATLRIGWITLAHAYPYFDPFGVPRVLNGSAMFAKLNQNLSTLGIGALLIAPTSLACGNPLAITMTLTGAPLTAFSVGVSSNPTGQEAVIIRVTKPLSPGIISLGNTSTIIQSFPAGTAGPYDIFAKYHSKHATVASGSLIFVTVNYVNTMTGYAGQQIITSANAP